MKKNILKPTKIIDKVFTTTKKGYDPVEVDTFLDNIHESYEIVYKKLLKSKKEMIEKTDKIDILESNINESTRHISKFKKHEDAYHYTIEDNMAKRISNIEEKLEIVLENVLNKNN